MKRGLSLIPIVGGGVGLILAGVLLVYTRMLGNQRRDRRPLPAQHDDGRGRATSPSATRKPGYAGAGQLLLPGQRRRTAGCRRNSGEMLDTPPYKEHRRQQLLGNWDDDDEGG